MFAVCVSVCGSVCFLARGMRKLARCVQKQGSFYCKNKCNTSCFVIQRQHSLGLPTTLTYVACSRNQPLQKLLRPIHTGIHNAT